MTNEKKSGAAWVDEIRQGYSMDVPNIALGVAVDDTTPVPDAVVRLPLGSMNRHGLVAGATGTGKTVTLQVLAEQLSAAGVPVFLADVKGDLSGLATPAEPNDKLAARTQSTGQQWQAGSYPVEFYALGGQGKGVPVRATVTSFGPLLLSKVLGLNATQESSLGLVFHYADQRGLPLVDLKDLRAVIQYLTSDEGKQELKDLGGISAATAGVLLRELITFADSGADVFFGEPEFDTQDFLRMAQDGRGIISCMELPAVRERPQLFSTFLMWLLADLFHDLPEVGNPEKPKLVFFFDEAHLLFDGASKDFLDSIEQTVRLIRSKGVGVFFVTQSPKDVPPDVLAQLGNRIQHALRAFTPEDAKALKAAAGTYPKSGYELTELLTQLGTGEAIVTVLSEKGAPTPVAWTMMYAPTARIGVADDATIDGVIAGSQVRSKYVDLVDRETAYEMLAKRVQGAGQEAGEAGQAPAPAPEAEKPARKEKEEPGMLEKLGDNPMVKSMLRSAGTALGREITRSIFGTSARRRR